jgi:hypothetical protein
MNLAHLHLLLNHWPIIGTFIATGLLLVALLARSEDLEEVTLALFALLGLVAIPAYLSGPLVQDVVRTEAGIAEALVESHQGAALLALVALLVTGSVAWVGLWQMRRRSRPAPSTLISVLLLSLLTVWLMGVAGNTGGAIRHPEILSGEPGASFVGDVGARLRAGIEYTVTGSNRWVWPFLETLHFVGLALLVGATGVLNLRLLGFFKQWPALPFHRFLPWGIAGLGLNVVTGMLFFIGMPFFYVYNADFHVKIAALVAAGAMLLLHTTRAFSSAERLEAGQDASIATKALAAASLVLWVVVIVSGRYMPLFEDTLDPRFTSLLP